MTEKITTEEVRLLLKYIALGYKVPDIVHDVIFDTAVREVENKDKVVLIKRDPNIERDRIQAVYVKVINGKTMDIHPSTVGGFGADFDGDMMAIYVPMSNEAQAEAKNKMMSVTSNSSINSPNFKLSNDMLAGIYTITRAKKAGAPVKLKNLGEANQLAPSTQIEIKVKGKVIRTTAGKVIFNNALPEWYPFINEEVPGGLINEILSNIIKKNKRDYARTVDNLMKIGFYYATVYPQSIGIDMFELPPNIEQLKKDLGATKDVAKQIEIIDEMEKQLLIHLEKNVPELYILVKSKAAKGAGQLRQIMIAKGLVSDVSDNILPPITKAMNDGYSPEEYFEASVGARKGVVDRSLNTAHGGYAYRKMVYVMGNLEADINTGNCRTQLTLDVKLTKDLFKRMPGRFIQTKEGMVKPVTEKMIGYVIPLRSPVYCKSKGICRTCYGELINQINTSNVGIVAAQEVTSLSERIMKCSAGLVHYRNELVWIGDIFDFVGADAEVKNEYGLRIESKKCNEIVDGKNGKVKATSIDKHKPNDDMLILETYSGNFIACQANHPLWIKSTPLHHLNPNDQCRLYGKEEYESFDDPSNSTVEKRRHFTPVSNVTEERRADAVTEYNTIWIDNSIVYNSLEKKLRTNGYILGTFILNGKCIKFDRWPGICIATKNNTIKERILKENNNFKRFVILEDGVTFRSQKEKEKSMIRGVNEKDFRLCPDFINFNKEWLKDFLTGLIDNNGKTKTDVFSTSSILVLKSYPLVQQVRSICMKLGYTFGMKPEGGNMTGDDLRFICKIRYPSDSYGLPTFEEIDEVIPSKHIRKTVKGFDVITKIHRIRYWNDDVYDIKTETNEFMMGMVQNHNSFHCIDGDMLLYIEEDGEKRLDSFKSIWEHNNNQINITEKQEEKIVSDLKVWDTDKFINVKKIIRHKKDQGSKMVMVRDKGGDFIICQDNHPLMFSKNTGVCKKCDTPFIKPKSTGVWECPICRSHPSKVTHKSNEAFIEVEPKEFIKSKYFTNNNFPIWNQEVYKNPLIEPYLLGFFLAEGSFIMGNSRSYPIGICFSQNEGELLNEITKKLNINFDDIIINGCSTRPTKKQIIIYDRILSENMMLNHNRYSFEKRIGNDIINYSDEILSKILCGIIDGDGSFIPEKSRTYISMELTSVKLIQEIHHILNKFNINHNVTLSTVKPLTRHQSYTMKIYPSIEDKDIFKYSYKIDLEILPKKNERKKYDSLINYYKDVFWDNNEYVYDLTTETGTLSINGIFSHNTGGVSELKRYDIIEAVMKNVEEVLRDKVTSRLKQVDNTLIAKDEFVRLRIPRKIYRDEYRIDIDEEYITLPNGYFDLVMGDITTPVTIEQEVKIYLKEGEMSKDEEYIEIIFPPDSKLVEVELQQQDPTKLVQKMDQMVGGKSPWTTPVSLFMKFYDILGPTGSWDSVHLEVIISNILRAKKDPKQPARLKVPFDPITFPIKTLPYVISWPLGLAFENFGKGIRYGLISDRAPSSNIEKVLFGEPLVEEK